jgi:hypothetical protein
MRWLKIMQFGLMMLFISATASAGIEDVTIDLQLLNPHAQVFIVGDFRSSLGTTNYFILNLANDGPEIRMKLKLDLFYNNVRIAWVESSPFDMPNSTIIPLPPYSNQQLSQGVTIPGASPPYDQIKLGDFETDLSAVNNLENQILATGKLPSGVYDFRATAIGVPAGGPPAEDQTQNHTLTITNPTTLELLFPGRSVAITDIEEIATTFPYFQWQSDVNPTAADYNLSVYEKFAEDETVDDVLSHPPMLQIEGYGVNFFQYPVQTDPPLLSGQVVGPVRLLENGKIYYWLVESVVLTGTGDYVIFKSDIFRFKVSDLAGQVNYAPQILSLLEQILGPDYWPVLQQLRDDGFEPNGKIFWERNEIDISELLIILGKITRGEAEVKGVEIY